MFDLILFDYDGTLVDSMPSIVHSTRRLFEEKGLADPGEERVRTCIADGKGLEYFFRLLRPELEENKLDQWIAQWRAIYDAEAHPYTTPYPGALDTLDTLSSMGIPCAIVSNKGQIALLRSVQAHGFAPLVQLVVGDDPGQPKKPKPEMYHQRIAPHFPGLDPTRVLMVGDSESDLAFGKAFGGSSCFATYGYGNRDTCLTIGAEMVINNLTELIKLTT